MSAVTKTPDLGEQVKRNNDRFEKLEKSFTALADRLEKTPAYPPGANPQQVFGVPHARRGVRMP